jgi:glucose/arabinose dehydrogenase
MPNGVAFRNGALYVAEVNKIWRYDNIESSLPAIPDPVLITDKLPSDAHHGWKFIRFGPDDKLYVPVGAPCNICKKDEAVYASICRMNPDGSDFEIYAEGVRNTVGFDWHPKSGELYFGDNGRDWMGNDMPPCELNRATKKGQHFGYPWCHGGLYADDEITGRSCNEFTAPAQNLGAHVAPVGMRFYTGDLLPVETHNQILLCEHGSWNREQKVGYRVVLLQLNDKGEVISYEPFIDGWLEDEESLGRPADLEVLPDGSLLISDDLNGVIYRVSKN